MSNRIVSGLGWTTVSSLSRNIVSLVQLAILTRFLSKEAFGVVAIAFLFVNFTQIFLDLGISVGIIHRQNITNREYSSLFWLNIFFGISLTGILYLLTPLLTASYDSPDLPKVVRLLCLTIFINSIGIQQRTYAQKKCFFLRIALIEIVSSFVIFAVAVGAAIKGFGVYSLAFSTLAGGAVNNVTHFVIGLRKDSRLSFHFSIAETLPYLKIGVYSMGSRIMDFFARELDIIIISATLGLEFLGLYNIAKRLPVAIYSFINPIVTRVFTPLFAEIQNSTENLREKYRLTSKALSWVSFPVFFLLAALAPSVLYYLYGSQYVDGAVVVAAFCFMYAFDGANGICGSLQVALARTDIGLWWTIYHIATVAAVYYCCSQFGITVFLFGLAGLFIIDNIMIWVMQFRPMTKISFTGYVHNFSTSMVICFVLAVVIYFIDFQPSLIFSIIAGIVFVVVYLVVLLHTKEKPYIAKTLKMLGVKIRI